MPKSVEERIVEMRFDNATFEKNAKQTLGTLDKLKNSLNFSGAVKSFSELDKASKNVSMASLAASVEGIASKFTTLGIIGVTALQDITRTAIHTGTQLVKSLTLDPVMSGFQEYETKMNAITTILTNTQDKGTTLEDVNKTLAELNEYADLTIYNFAEMTRNIGTFTAAGVDLETSAKAIKGIANLAAGSGSSAQQASVAMYQLSQALAAGRVSLQDWNSVVNAGMGGQLFQNALKETAKQMGIVVDESVSFRESISAAGGQESWLTSDVLIKTLEKFAEDDTLVKAATQVKTVTQLLDTMKESVQSGWAVSWEYIIGDREEAISILTKISDGFNNLIGPSTEARNEMLRFWNEVGGRDAVIRGLTNVMTALGNVLSPIAKAFKAIFPSIDGPKLVALSEAFEKLTEKLLISEGAMAAISAAFSGLFSIIRVVRDVFFALIDALFPLTSLFGWIGRGAIEAAGFLGKLTKSLADLLDRTNIISSFSDALRAFIGGIVYFAQDASKWLEKLFELISEDLEKAKRYIRDAANSIAEFGNSIKDSIGKKTQALLDSFNTGVEKSARSTREFGEAAKSSFDSIKESGLEYASEKMDGFNAAIEKVKTALSSLKDKIAKTFGPIASQISDAFSNVTVTDAIGVGLIGGIVYVIKKLVDQMKDILSDGKDIVTNVNEVLGSVKDSLETWQNSIKADILLKIAGAIGILAVSIIALSFIDPEKVKTGLIGVSILMAEVIASMKLLDKLNIDGITSATANMILISTALTILAGALLKLKEFQTWDETWPALLSLSVLMAGLTAAMKVLASTKNMDGSAIFGAGVAMILFATAMRILADALSGLTNISDISQLTASLTAILILMGGLTVSAKALSSNVDGMELIKSSIGLVIFATAVGKLADSMKSFAALKVGEIVKSLTTLAILLAEISIFIRVSKLDQLKEGRKVIVEIAVSMLLLYAAVKLFGEMDIWTLIQGLLSVTALIAVLAGAVKLIGSTNLSGVGGTFMMLAISLNLLIVPLLILGSINIWTLVQGVVGLALVLGVLSASVVALTAVSGSSGGLAKISAGLLLLGVALNVLMVPILLMGSVPFGVILAGLGSLIAILAVLGISAALLSPFSVALLAVAGAVALFGIAVLSLGGGLMLMATALVTMAALGVAGATSIATSLTIIVSTVAVLIPLVIAAIGKGIIALASVIAEGAPIIGEAILAVLMTILSIMQSFIPAVVETVIILFVGILNAFAEHLPDIIDAAFNLVLNFINGLADAIDKYSDALRAAIWKLILAIKDAFLGFAEDLWESLKDIGKYVIEGLIDGFWSGVEAVGNAVTEIGSNIINGFKDVLGINSPSKEAYAIARFVDQGLINGLISMKSDVAKASSKVGTSMLDSVKSAVANMADIVSSDVDMQPTIRPVIDLSGVQNGSKRIGEIFASVGGVTFKTNASAAARTASTFRNGNSTSEGSEKSGGNTYQFTQNNYSPKSLSRIDIYRQTKNQFAMLKGLT